MFLVYKSQKELIDLFESLKVMTCRAVSFSTARALGNKPNEFLQPVSRVENGHETPEEQLFWATTYGLIVPPFLFQSQLPLWATGVGN